MSSKLLLKNLAYYRTGGSYLSLHRPTSSQELAEIRKLIHKESAPYFVLGAGSNSLVVDEDWPGHVISLDQMKKIERLDHLVHVEAGITNTELSHFAFQHLLSGVAWMNRLPGQIGGTVRMNARCYGGEISQVVSEVEVVDRSGKVKTYQPDHQSANVFRGYKDTIFMQNEDIIVSAVFVLAPGNQNEIKNLMDHCEQDRIKKGQFLYPSCGCVFKNNYQIGIPSGMLLDQAGVHDLSNDRVEINPKHANFVFNKNATSRDILEISFAMRERVYQKFGVWLEYEMEVLGSMPKDLETRFFEKKSHRLNEIALKLVREQFLSRSGLSEKA